MVQIVIMKEETKLKRRAWAEAQDKPLEETGGDATTQGLSKLPNKTRQRVTGMRVPHKLESSRKLKREQERWLAREARKEAKRNG